MRAKNTQDSPKETQEGEQLPLLEIRKATARNQDCMVLVQEQTDKQNKIQRGAYRCTKT